MKLRSHFNSRMKGFSLPEVIVAIGILVILFAAALPIGINFYTSYQLSSETRMLVALLEQARNRAMVNFYEADHGVSLLVNSFILFRGDNYLTRVTAADEDFPRSTFVSIAGPSELVFTSLSGRTASSTFTLTNSRGTKYVYVNQEGRIQF